AVELEEHHPAPFAVGVPDGQAADDQRLAPVDVDGEFLVGIDAVEEGRGGQDADVAEGPPVLGEVGEDLRVHEVGGQLVVGDLPADPGLGLVPGGGEVGV